jgi:hypothetical protein
MRVPFRVVAISGGLAALIAGALASPAFFPGAFADEPQHSLVKTAGEIFPKAFDPSTLKKFDVTFDNSVSTKVSRTQIVHKIAFGQKSDVAIVTTPSGVYSSDALTSPYVRYPGIEVTPKHARHHFSYSTSTSRYGTGVWSSFSAGSFTFYNYSFTPAKRGRS